MDAQYSPRPLVRTLALSLALVLGAGLAHAQNSPSRLETAVVRLAEVDLSYPAEAVVEAVRQSTIAAQVQGRVVEVRVDAGQRVKQGDVLMRIDEREAAQAVLGAEAQIAQAQANLANARASHERNKNLLAQKFVSQAVVDQSEAALKAAEAQHRAAQAGQGQASTARSFTTVQSPLSGVVAQRLTELGEMAQPGRALVSVFDPTSLRVVASIPQYKVAAVRQSLRARVEFPESGTWVDGARVEVLPTVDARTHTAQARVLLPESVAGVAPGVFARAHFVVGRGRKLLVPHKAVVRRGEVTAVYVVDAQGLPHFRQVRLGEAMGAGVEVLAGLNDGESVALEPVKATVRLKQQPAQ